MRDPLPVLPLRAEQCDQRQVGDGDDDHERSQSSECVHVVGGGEPAAALEGVTETEVLDHRGRDRQAEEREPGHRGQHDQPRENRDGREDQHREDVGRDSGPGSVQDAAGPHVRGGDERPEREQHHRLHVRAAPERQLSRECKRDPERQQRPESVPVRANRLGDELADGALARR